jgi:hypothetical protein
MDAYIPLSCPSCGAKAVIHSGDASFTCDYCGSTQVLNPALFPPPKPPEENGRSPVPVPEGVSLHHDGDTLTIVRRWYSPKYLFLAAFSVFWDGFLLVWYSIALSSHGSLMMICFPILHVAAGLFITYSTLAGFLNRTTIRVSPVEFIIQHDPLPWLGEMKRPVSILRQLYCKHASHSSKNNTDTYVLCAVLEDGRTINLVQNLDSPDIGFFIEQQIENWLHIPDYAVGGEMPRV